MCSTIRSRLVLDLQRRIRSAEHPTNITNSNMSLIDLLVHLMLYVRAAKDVHILLAGSENPLLTDPVYEIVLDAGGETFSLIRRRQLTRPFTKTKRNNVIEADEITSIVLRITQSGRITVTLGTNSSVAPLLDAFDPDPVSVRYLSFAAWRNSPWVAHFDCHNNSTDNTTKPKTSWRTFPNHCPTWTSSRTGFCTNMMRM